MRRVSCCNAVLATVSTYDVCMDHKCESNQGDDIYFQAALSVVVWHYYCHWKCECKKE